MNEVHAPSAPHREPTCQEIRETRQALAPLGLAHGLITNPKHAKMALCLPQLPPVKKKDRTGRAKRPAPLTEKQKANAAAQERRWAAIEQGRTSPPPCVHERAKRSEKRLAAWQKRTAHGARNEQRRQETALARAAQRYAGVVDEAYTEDSDRA